MSFNLSKYNMIRITQKKYPLAHTYYLKGVALEIVDTAMYLRISITNDLT